MDVSADQSTQTSAPRLQPAPAETQRLPRRRRPTGEAPPLPYHLQTSGVRWLIAGVVLVALTIVVFARGLRGLAVDVTVADDAVVRWLVGLQAPGLVGAWRGLAALSSWWVINGLLVGLLVALLVLRRFRHLIVVVVLAQLLTWSSRPGVPASPSGHDRSGWPSGPAGAAGRCRRSRSPFSRRCWWGSCTRWCRRAAGATPASGSRPGW